MNTVGIRLVESTKDLYWAIGLSPRDTASTKPSYYPGKNKLGQVLEQVKVELHNELALSNQIDTETPDNTI